MSTLVKIIANALFSQRKHERLKKPQMFALLDTAVAFRGFDDKLRQLSLKVHRITERFDVLAAPLARAAEQFKNLPHEILLRVLDYLGDPLDALKFGAVCRKFREVSLVPSASWSAVRYSFPLKIAEMCIERSKSRMLSVDICGFGGDRTTSYLDAIFPSSSRWSSLKLDLSSDLKYDISYTGADYDSLCSRMASLEFFNLHTLELKQHASESVHGKGFDDPQRNFLQSLALPVLKNLRLENVVPRNMSCPSVKSVQE